MRDRPLYALLLLQLLVTAAASAYALWAAPSLATAYAQQGGALPLLARLALMRWPLMAVCWPALVVVVGALLRRGQRRARLRVMALALTLSALAFVVLAMASVTPMLSV